ncbi:hypothetical protein [Clostridium sp. UBA6640]|uniref:hypothetical protein n=1 Tax=Clostridium sp. UBA6640 TaxID=1946370 RepID=UPI0025BA40D8|nr:hypothetical protein [Clostridium sp. UBA6640]
MKKLSIAPIVMTVLLLNTTSVSATPCGCDHNTCTLTGGNSYNIKVPHPIKYTINGTIYSAECDAYETHWYSTYNCSKCGSTNTQSGVRYVHPSQYCPQRT